MIKTINLPYKITGTKLFFPFKAICSVTDKEFGGEIVIEYYPNKKALEYVDAELVINKIASKDTTAEELAHKVFIEIEKSIKPKYLKILIDVKYSKAHKPAHIWIEKGKVNK